MTREEAIFQTVRKDVELHDVTGVWLDPRDIKPSKILGLQGGDFIACKVRYRKGAGWDMKIGWYDNAKMLIHIPSLPHRGYTLEKYLILPKTNK